MAGIDEKGIIIIVIAIFAVLMILLAWASMQGVTDANGNTIIPGSDWDDVAQGVAKFFVAIIIFGLVVSGLVILVRKR